MSLPIRGSGLRTGRAGARRFGVPRTDKQRLLRHYALGNGDTALWVALASLLIGAGIIVAVAILK